MDWRLVLGFRKRFVLGNNGLGEMPKYEHIGRSWHMWKEGTKTLERKNEQEVKDTQSLFWHWRGVNLCAGHPSVPLRQQKKTGHLGSTQSIGHGELIDWVGWGGTWLCAWVWFVKCHICYMLCKSPILDYVFAVRLHDSISEEGFHYLVFDL